MLPKPLEISPEWLPKHLQQEGTRFRLKLYASDRQVLRRKTPIPVSVWAEKHRVLPPDSSVPGPWRNATVPYLAGVMDASFFPSVQQIILCWPPQTGKSDSINNCIGYAADRAPGNVLYVYPDEMTARENNRDRIQPMFQHSPRLKQYLSGYQDDEAALCLRLRHMKIYMGWANSAARLANKPLPYVVLDEEDKYPVTAGRKEGSPVDLAKKRTRTFSHMRKIWRMSTPTIETGSIWTALQTEAEVVFMWWVVCPECGHEQQMAFHNVKWPSDNRDPIDIESRRLAWYECAGCHCRWDDAMRDLAVRRGQWRSRHQEDSELAGVPLSDYLQRYRPISIGFHLHSYVSPFVSLSEAAAAFLRGQKDKTKLRDFCNAHEAVPWVEYGTERKVGELLALRDHRPRGIVPPEGVLALTAGVDTQKDGFWYEIRAWKVILDPFQYRDESNGQAVMGYMPILESYQVREGFVESFSALASILFTEQYADPSGNRYIVNLALIDAMGEKTSDVYDFCRAYPGWIFPVQGVRKMTMPYHSSVIEYYPGTHKLMPGGVRLIRIDTTYYKNLLAQKLLIAPGDPGAWYFHAETTEEWGRQMLAEYVDEATGFWECKANRANHAWDCSVYNLCAADVFDVKGLARRPTASEDEASIERRVKRHGTTKRRW